MCSSGGFVRHSNNTESYEVRNCTIAFNNYQGIASNGIARLALVNTVIWDSLDYAFWVAGPRPQFVRYSCVDRGRYASGLGCISAGAAFVDADGPDDDPWTWQDNDFRLEPCSVGVDSGSNSEAPPDVADIDGDGNVLEPMPSDLRGSARLFDCPVHDDDGEGSPPFIDMGAFETSSATLPPQRIYVDNNASGLSNGESWADAHRSLSDALARAGGCRGRVTEIWVTAGTYAPSNLGNAGVSFMLAPETRTYGGFVGTESSVDERPIGGPPTILSGAGSRTPIVNAARAAGASALDRFDIRGARPGVSSEPAAGILAEGESAADGPTLALDNCRIMDNQAHVGPAAIGARYATLRFSDCVVADNACYAGIPGIHAAESTVVAIRTCFARNGSSDGMGGALLGGAGLFLNCDFVSNRSDNRGGAAQQTSAAFIHCRFVDNFAAITGMALFSCSGPIVGCLFIDRSVANYSMIAACPNMANCTILSPAPYLPIVSFCGLHNCIVWTHAAQVPAVLVSDSPVTHSCIRGWTGGGEGNISDDPLFVNFGNGDYRLSLASPCIDAGSNLALPPDAFDIDEDGDTSEPLPLDYAGRPRRSQIPSRPDTGAGDPPLVDMGAHEAICVGDLDGDGVIDLADLATLLIHFGASSSGYVEGDLNADGRVDLTDLATLLAALGQPC